MQHAFQPQDQPMDFLHWSAILSLVRMGQTALQLRQDPRNITVVLDQLMPRREVLRARQNMPEYQGNYVFEEWLRGLDQLINDLQENLEMEPLLDDYDTAPTINTIALGTGGREFIQIDMDEVNRLICLGVSRKDIAGRAGVSYSTLLKRLEACGPPILSDVDLDRAVQDEISAYPRGGYRYIQGAL
ncbi:hypothetical protein Dda_6914 [Drechslerella dactyloides]|uniref:Uncharacterized protein n=1 Tax=Drechslerella dactyloides TaxID=74499 RepID=A0AAD6ITB0_DREDA|nr:hypothetical protein Dda_6914 [Drechslerella dactyloides]